MRLVSLFGYLRPYHPSIYHQRTECNIAHPPPTNPAMNHENEILPSIAEFGELEPEPVPEPEPDPLEVVFVSELELVTTV